VLFNPENQAYLVYSVRKIFGPVAAALHWSDSYIAPLPGCTKQLEGTQQRWGTPGCRHSQLGKALPSLGYVQ